MHDEQDTSGLEVVQNSLEDNAAECGTKDAQEGKETDQKVLVADVEESSKETHE